MNIRSWIYMKKKNQTHIKIHIVYHNNKVSIFYWYNYAGNFNYLYKHTLNNIILFNNFN